jgi:hypothetical protein
VTKPAVETLGVQYLVSFVVGLIVELIVELSEAFNDFGLTVSSYAGNATVMATLTTGIFGNDGGLIYWINEKVFYVIENMPWCALGQGLGAIIEGLLNPACP